MRIKQIISIIVITCFCWQQLVWADALNALRPISSGATVITEAANTVGEADTAAPRGKEPTPRWWEWSIIVAAIICAAIALYLGSPSMVDALYNNHESHMIARGFRGAFFIASGDAMGRYFRGGSPYSKLLWTARAAFTFTASFFITLTGTALITGIGFFVPAPIEFTIITAIQGFGRAFSIWPLGAVFISFFYALFIPAFFERIAIRQDNSLSDKEKKEQLDEYRLERQARKTYYTVRGRWWVVALNIWYMNLLPWWWITPEVGWAIVLCLVTAWMSYYCSSKRVETCTILRKSAKSRTQNPIVGHLSAHLNSQGAQPISIPPSLPASLPNPFPKDITIFGHAA